MSAPAAAAALPMPAPLRPDDAVALLSPAGPAPAELIDQAVGLVTDWGLRPVLMPGARERHPRLGYLAGTDEQRAADLTAAWCDPAFTGVLCLRGGYGTVRLLDRLDADAWRSAEPKRLFGSSDITCLHEFLGERVGVGSWFTPMPATTVGRDPIAMAGLSWALFGEPEDWTLDAAGAEPLLPGSATGRLAGGNLSLLAMTVGARDRSRPAEPRVVLLEDVDEPAYRLDGYLQALLRAGWFDTVTGVALGSWLNCGEPGEGEAEIRDLVADTLRPLGIPVLAGLGFGHGPAAASLPLGAQVVLSAEPGDPGLRVVGGRR